MPELPEVETVVRDLRPQVVGRRLDAIRVSDLSLRRPWRPEWAERLQGKRVEEISRRGKWIVIRLTGHLHLVLHLGMTGQLTVKERTEALADHVHLRADLRPGKQQLRFRDIRRFGSATLFEGAAALDQFFTQSELGPEPFDLDGTYWRACLAGTARCLKAILLDQRIVAGVGNIYADESLHEARLPPMRLGRDTSPGDADRLRRAIRTVLNRAIKRRGTTLRDYVGGLGLQGEYQNELRAYGRVGQPCRRCQALILRIRLAGRSTFFCPRCQAS